MTVTQERADVIGYLVNMRDTAKEMMQFMKLRGEGQQFWQRRFEMCDRAVKMLVAGDVK